MNHSIVTILIIDEHDHVRGLLASGLDKSGPFRVVAHTSSPLIGTELAWFWEPDIILIDLKGRGRYAVEVCRRIARASPASRIVIFTSYLVSGEEKSYLAAGAARCLLKGVTLRDLARELRALARPVAA